MTALDRQPKNKNYLSQLSFAFNIHKLPNVNFFVQEANLPGFSIPDVYHPNPFVDIPYHGDRISFDPFEIAFVIDEDLMNYREIFEWMNGYAFPDNYEQYKKLHDQGQQLGSGQGLFSDASLLVGTNLKNPNIEVVFKDCFPVSLSGFIFDTTSEDVNYISCRVQFKYTSFNLNTLPK